MSSCRSMEILIALTFQVLEYLVLVLKQIIQISDNLVVIERTFSENLKWLYTVGWMYVSSMWIIYEKNLQLLEIVMSYTFTRQHCHWYGKEVSNLDF